MDDRKSLETARRQVRAMESFYIHAAVYALVCAILLAVNITSGSSWWVQWPMLGWGLGLIAHGVAVFGGMSRRLEAWRERKIRELMGRGSS